MSRRRDITKTLYEEPVTHLLFFCALLLAVSMFVVCPIPCAPLFWQMLRRQIMFLSLSGSAPGVRRGPPSLQRRLIWGILSKMSYEIDSQSASQTHNVRLCAGGDE